MERFRTIRISDPRFESNNLRYMTIKSSNLRGRGNISLYIPDTERKDLPIVTLLHGVYGSSYSWTGGAGAHLTAQRLIKTSSIAPMILAMPSDGLWGDGSAYLPHNNYNFEKWIQEDVIDAVKMTIPQASNSSTNFIGGLSMGGFGALKIGAKYSDTYRAFSGLSSITSLDQLSQFVEEDITNYSQLESKDESVYATIAANRDNLSPFRFDCGRDDVLIDYNRKLHQQLSAADIDHLFEEHAGAHEWPYWEEHLQDSLLFFNSQL